MPALDNNGQQSGQTDFNHAAPLRVLLLCAPEMDNFVDDFIAALRPEIEITKLVGNHKGEIERAVSQFEVIWLEWGNELAQAVTYGMAAALKHKRVICRIHSYEVLNGLADEIFYPALTDLIFVTDYMRRILQDRKPEAGQVPRVHIIPNGVNMQRFAFRKNRPGPNLAYVGGIGYKKDPTLLLHAFWRLHQTRPVYKLHLAGLFEEMRYAYSLKNFIDNNQLASAVFFNGWQKDVAGWLQDKHFIVSSSLMETQQMGIMEAMAMGIKPLIYYWPWAATIYPRDLLWANLDEFVGKVNGPYHSEKYRQFVQDNYSLELQCDRLRRMLLRGETINPTPIVWQ